MPSFQQMLAGRCTKLPVFQLVPGQSLTAGYFLIQVEPAIRHGLNELTNSNARHAMTELALMCYLMGMGFDYRTAKAIVESWETDDSLLAQGLLTTD